MSDVTIDPATALEVAERLTDVLRRSDSVAAAALYADDAVVWHCTDQISLSRAAIVGTLDAIASVATAEVEVKERFATASGFVQTQINTYRLQSGAVASFHAALVVTLDGSGRISRLDEYLDGAGLAPLIAALT